MPIIRTTSTVTATLIEDYFVSEIPEGLVYLGLFDHATTGVRVFYQIDDEETSVIEDAHIRTDDDEPLDNKPIWT